MKDQWSFNGGTLGNLSVEKLLVEDFCPIKIPHTAFKSSFRYIFKFWFINHSAKVSIGLTKVKLNTDPRWTGVMKDHTLHILRTILRQTFGEMFYRVFILGFKQHDKGILIIESAALIGKISSVQGFRLILVYRSKSWKQKGYWRQTVWVSKDWDLWKVQDGEICNFCWRTQGSSNEVLSIFEPGQMGKGQSSKYPELSLENNGSYVSSPLCLSVDPFSLSWVWWMDF